MKSLKNVPRLVLTTQEYNDVMISLSTIHQPTASEISKCIAKVLGLTLSSSSIIDNSLVYMSFSNGTECCMAYDIEAHRGV